MAGPPRAPRGAALLAVLLLALGPIASSVRTASGMGRLHCEAEQFRGFWHRIDEGADGEQPHKRGPPDKLQLAKTTPLAFLTPWRFRAVWLRRRSNNSVDEKIDEVVFGDVSLNEEQCCLVGSEPRLPYLCLSQEGHIVVYDAKRPRSIWRGPDTERELANYTKIRPAPEGGLPVTPEEEEFHEAPEEDEHREEHHDEKLDSEEKAQADDFREKRRKASLLTGSWALDDDSVGEGCVLPDVVQFAQKHVLGLVVSWRYRGTWHREDAVMSASGGAHAHDTILGDATWNDAHGCLAMSDPRMRFWRPDGGNRVAVYDAPPNSSIAAGPDERRLVAWYTKRPHGRHSSIGHHHEAHVSPVRGPTVVATSSDDAKPQAQGRPQGTNFSGVWFMAEGAPDSALPETVQFVEANAMNLFSVWKYRAIWHRAEEQDGENDGQKAVRKVVDAVAGDAAWVQLHGCLMVSDPRIKFWCPQENGSAIVYRAAANASIRTGPSEERRVARYERKVKQHDGAQHVDAAHAPDSQEGQLQVDDFEGHWELSEKVALASDPPTSVDLSRSSPQGFLTLWRSRATWPAAGRNGRKEVVIGEASANDGARCIVSANRPVGFWCLKDDGSLELVEAKSPRSLWLGPNPSRPIARYQKTASVPGVVVPPPAPPPAVAKPMPLAPMMLSQANQKAERLLGAWELLNTTGSAHAPPGAVTFRQTSPLAFIPAWKYEATWSTEVGGPGEVASGDASLVATLGCLTTPDERMRFWCAKDDADLLVLFEPKDANALWHGPDWDRPAATYRRLQRGPATLEAAPGADGARVGGPPQGSGEAAAPPDAPRPPAAGGDLPEVEQLGGKWRKVEDAVINAPATIEFTRVDSLGAPLWRYSAVWTADAADGADEPGPRSLSEGEAKLTEGSRCLVTGDPRMRFWRLQGDGTLALFGAKHMAAEWRGPDMGRPIAAYTRDP